MNADVAEELLTVVADVVVVFVVVVVAVVVVAVVVVVLREIKNQLKNEIIKWNFINYVLNCVLFGGNFSFISSNM